MNRGFVVAVAGAAIVVSGLAGCSSNKASHGSATAAAGKGTAKLTVDGKDQSITGDIGCTTSGEIVAISIGDQSKGLSERHCRATTRRPSASSSTDRLWATPRAFLAATRS